MHEDKAGAPIAAEYVPSGQLVQDVEPTLAAKVAAGQLEQDPAELAEYVPALQAGQLDEPAFDEYVPGEQALHKLDDEALVLERKKPSAHAVQLDWPV